MTLTTVIGKLWHVTSQLSDDSVRRDAAEHARYVEELDRCVEALCVLNRANGAPAVRPERHLRVVR
jgi:hypothetical protein